MVKKMFNYKKIQEKRAENQEILNTIKTEIVKEKGFEFLTDWNFYCKEFAETETVNQNPVILHKDKQIYNGKLFNTVYIKYGKYILKPYKEISMSEVLETLKKENLELKAKVSKTNKK